MRLRSLIPFGRERSAAGAEVDLFERLQREIDRLFADVMREVPPLTSYAFGAALKPSMDVVETDKELQITAELPGLDEKDIEISVADGLLTIRGEKKMEEEEEEEKSYWLQERSFGPFARTIELPETVDPDKIDAQISKGVLTITIPKRGPAQVKKVNVKAAA